MVPRSLRNELRESLQHGQNEIIGMLRFDAQNCESLTRKVSEIEGYDHTRAAANRGGQDVPVVLIGSSIESMRCSYSVTIASGSALSIRFRVRSSVSRLRSGRFLRRLRIHSS